MGEKLLPVCWDSHVESDNTRDAGTPSSPKLVAGLFGFRLSHINTRPSWEEKS